MTTKDHFFSISNSKIIGWAFCPIHHHNKLEAKQRIKKILEDQLLTYQVHYIGTIDYNEMDKSFLNYLYVFKKYGSIWVTLNDETIQNE